MRWTLEDCRHVSRRLEQASLAAGERLVRVAPHRMGASRKGERERGKLDRILSRSLRLVDRRNSSTTSCRRGCGPAYEFQPLLRWTGIGHECQPGGSS